MSNNSQWYDDDDDDQGRQQQSGKGLRAQLEKALRENEELKTRVEKAEKQARETALSTVLKDKGLSPKVAKLLPADVEPTADAVSKWLEEYGDVFTAKPAEESQAQGDPAEGASDDGNADVANQLNRISGAAAGGKPPARESDLMAQLTDPNLTPEKLMELIGAAGGGYGVG